MGFPTSAMKMMGATRYQPDLYVDLVDVWSRWDASDASSISPGGGEVTTWSVGSGSSNTTAFTGSTDKPTDTTTMGDNTSLDFDGTDFLLKSGQYLTDDLFDIFITLNGAPQNNKTVLCQNDSLGNINRTNFLASSDTGAFDKARLFFNNGVSYSMVSTTPVFNGENCLVRVRSDGAGFQAFQINGGPDEGTSTGQTWTPQAYNMWLGGIFSSGGANVQAGFTGEIGEIIICTSIQSAPVAAKLSERLMLKWNIW